MYIYFPDTDTPGVQNLDPKGYRLSTVVVCTWCQINNQFRKKKGISQNSRHPLSCSTLKCAEMELVGGVGKRKKKKTRKNNSMLFVILEKWFHKISIRVRNIQFKGPRS